MMTNVTAMAEKTEKLRARVKGLEAENKRLKELLETAHRYEIAHIYGSENAKDHRNGQKTGCVVCDMVSGRVPTEHIAKGE